MAAAKILTLQDVVSDDLNYEIWDVVENGIPSDPSKISDLATKIQPEDLSKWRDFVGKYTKALQILQSSLPDSVFRLILETASAKDLWDLLKEANKQAKLEKKSETLKPFFHRATEAQVNRVLVDIVSASANATPGLGRYPPFKREVGAIASAALDGFKNEAKKMVVALVDMERAFVPPQHFIRLSLDF